MDGSPGVDSANRWTLVIACWCALNWISNQNPVLSCSLVSLSLSTLYIINNLARLAYGSFSLHHSSPCSLLALMQLIYLIYSFSPTRSLDIHSATPKAYGSPFALQHSWVLFVWMRVASAKHDGFTVYSHLHLPFCLQQAVSLLCSWELLHSQLKTNDLCQRE